VAEITNPAKDKMAHFGFCKRIVDDLEKQAAFYRDVFELKELVRHSSATSVITGGPISEVNFQPTAEGGAILVLHRASRTSQLPLGPFILLGTLAAIAL
jgi:hypothetical protein